MVELLSKNEDNDDATKEPLIHRAIEVSPCAALSRDRNFLLDMVITIPTSTPGEVSIVIFDLRFSICIGISY